MPSTKNFNALRDEARRDPERARRIDGPSNEPSARS